MTKKKMKLGPVLLFLICLGCTVGIVFFVVTGSGQTVNLSAKTNEQLTDIPTIFIREDTCKALLKNYCINHGNVKYTFESFDNLCEIMIYGFGANKEQFYNNNTGLLSVTNRGFLIETHKDTIRAHFTRKTIKGISCVELPSDVLYSLMLQHPLIK